MPKTKTALLAGLAALALAGSAGYAAAQSPALHTLTVKTPDGGIATIEYTGNVAPKVRFGTAPVAPAGFFGTVSPFAGFDRISAEMDREMSVLLRQADLMAAAPAANPLYDATLKGAPQNGSSYSFVSTMNGAHVCSQSVQITEDAHGKQHVVRHSSGDCAAAPGLREGTAMQALPRNGHGMLQATSPLQPAATGLPHTYEAGYTPR